MKFNFKKMVTNFKSAMLDGVFVEFNVIASTLAKVLRPFLRITLVVAMVACIIAFIAKLYVAIYSAANMVVLFALLGVAFALLGFPYYYEAPFCEDF